MSSRYRPDAVEQERRRRFREARSLALAGLRHAEEARATFADREAGREPSYRDLPRGGRSTPLLPAPDWMERMVEAYPDPERQDWMRRELELWRGRR